jgi:hypothetical protein
LARENEALRERRRDDLASLVREKVNACRAYEAQVKALSGKGEIPDANDPHQRQELGRLAERMTALAVENHNRLKVAVAANRKLADAVAEAVKSATPGPGVYSRYGTVDRGRSSGAGAPLAISVNHTL